jgi:hypothetical protein
MSGSKAYINYLSVNPQGVSPDILDLSGGAGTVQVWIADLHGQTMPAGTVIALDSTNGEITSLKSYTVMNTNEVPDPISISLAPTENKEIGDNIGSLQITVTTPRGVVTYSDAITVMD